MNKRIRIVSIVTLVILSVSLGFAWYHNNRQVSITGDGASDSIIIQSDGILQVAFATDEHDSVVNIANAQFNSNLIMLLNGKGYSDITGNGLADQMFSPVLGKNGLPQSEEEFWKPAIADNAAKPNDNGHYAVADLYFRSDDKMDIYILNSSNISPHTEENNINLVNTIGSGIDYGIYNKFSDFANGLPSLNINQSPYGFFSRNLIAGATRVSFTEINKDGNGNYVDPSIPGMIWVPNSNYQLIKPQEAGFLSKVLMNGEKETSYTYYQKASEGSEIPYTLKTVYRSNNNDNKIIGELYRITNDGLIPVDIITLSEGQIVPAIQYIGFTSPVPAIWNGLTYINAASVTDLQGDTYLVAADYNEYTYSLTDGYAYKTQYGGNPIYVRPWSNGEEKGYVEVTRTSNYSQWNETETKYTEEADVQTIESNFQRDSAIYSTTRWVDEKNFSKEADSRICCDYKIATTSEAGPGYFYTRVRIAIWVEGTDREADINSNGGEFDVNLQFFGIRTE